MDVQASILVLHDPDAQAITVPNVAPAAATSPRKPPPKRVAARPVLMPNSTWNAMSALAGALLHLCPKRTCLSTTLYFKLSNDWSLSRGLGSRVMKSWQGTSVLQCAASCLSTESSSGRACMSGQCSNAGMLPGETLTWLAGGTARPQPVPAQSASAAAAAAPAAPTRRRDADTRRTARPSEDQVQQESVTVGDYLVKSLTAHSLDLPPRAAKVCRSTPPHLICSAMRSWCRC